MMWAGITYRGQHSYREHDATMNSRKVSLPPKDRVTDRVPYSSVTHDFTAVYGTGSFGERTLQYRFVMSDIRGGEHLKERIDRFIRWLYEPVGKSPLYDDRDPGYYYNAVCTQVADPVIIGGVVAEITVTFAADPYKYPAVASSLRPIPLSDARFPDLDGDGHASSTDASLILVAASEIAIGHPSGLTPEQELLADCDRDGVITAGDASLVMTFATECGIGHYHDDPAGWIAYLNRYLGRCPEVI